MKNVMKSMRKHLLTKMISLHLGGGRGRQGTFLREMRGKFMSMIFMNIFEKGSLSL